MATLHQNTQSTHQTATNQKNSKKPKVRDTPDSRKNEEQNFKGNDVTHNKKETQNNK
jgi:hypothetical protein